MKITYHRDSNASVAVRACIRQLGDNPARPELAIVFCGGKHFPREISEVMRKSLGSFPIVGGSAAGCITRMGFGYTGFELAIAFFFEGDPVPAHFATHGLRTSEREAGRSLGRQAREHASDDAVVMIFYDSVAANSPMLLHPAAPLVEGFYEGLGGARVHLIGGGLLTDMNLSDGWIYDGEAVSKHAAFALVFPAEVRAETVIMHGCRPVSTFMEITRIDGAEIYELDGRSALQVLEAQLGSRLGKDESQNLSLIATLGKKHGDPFLPFDENSYVNRLILKSNRETGSITIFEPDFAEGSSVQVMSRDNDLMLKSVQRAADEMTSRMSGRDILVTMYIDCAGRGSARSGADTEEAEIALSASKALGPFFGFYSGVEIAPVNGSSRPLDWTAVLTTLYMKR